MLKLLVVCAVLFSQALRAEDFISPGLWAKDISAALNSSSLKVIRNIVILSDDPAKQKAWDTMMAGVSSLSWFQYIDSENIKYLKLLNREKLTGQKNDVLIAKYLPVQLLLEEHANGIEAKVPGVTGFESLGTWPINATDQESGPASLEWLHKMLGYEAVVLDIEGKFILAALVQTARSTGQGVLVRDSADKYSLASLKVAGEALLNVRAVEGSLAVLEILVDETEGRATLPGAKILLGKSN